MILQFLRRPGPACSCARGKWQNRGPDPVVSSTSSLETTTIIHCDAMKVLLLIALTIAMAAAVAAQQPCTMTKDQLPAMRKLRLGMERAEFEKQYRGASILVMKRHAVDPSDFDGLEGIAFDFYHDRLYFIEFNFDPKTAKWEKVQDFAKNVSENLKVPESSWRFEPGDFLATMKCADFFVKLNSRFRSVTLRDTVAEKAKKAEEASKKTSKL